MEKNENIMALLGHKPSEPGEIIERIRNSDEPLTIVDSLSSYDLLGVMREADDEVRGDLLALFDKEKFDGLSDLSCWRDHSPDLDQLEDLVRPLVERGVEEAGQAYERLEPELRTLMLKRHLVVHLREDENEEVPAAQGSELIRCPDGYYFIEIPQPDDLPDVVRQLLAGLINMPFEMYQRELECVRHDFPSDLEESALRWRGSRLADLGFGTLEDGLALLTARPVEEFRKILDAASATPYPLRDPPGLPAVYVGNLVGRDLLDRSIQVLRSRSDEKSVARAQSIPGELGASTSLFLTALRTELADSKEVARDVGACRDLINLGLEVLVGNDPQEGAKALTYLVPSQIIQAGMSRLAPLRERAKKLLRTDELKVGDVPCGRLDPPHFSAVVALSSIIPRRWPYLEECAGIYSSDLEPLEPDLEPFATLEQVDFFGGLLDEAELVPRLIFRNAGWRFPEGAPREARAAALVTTALANAFLGSAPVLETIPQGEAALFLEKIAEGEVEEFVQSALAVLADRFSIEASGTSDPSSESDPARRLVLRLVHLGRERAVSGDTTVVMISS